MLPLFACACLACGGTIGVGTGGVGVGMNVGADSHRREIDDWHAARIQRLTSEDGWLSLVGLFPLPNGTHRFGSAADNDFVFPERAPAHAGTLTVADSVVTLRAADGVEMTHEGSPVGETVLASDRGGGKPTEIRLGTVLFYVIDRPGTLYLRVKDPESPIRRNFTGIERFPVSRKWRVEATLERYDPLRRVRIQNVAGFEEVVDCPGALVFELDGKEYRLEPMSQEGEEWFVVFGDATTGHETYGGGRYVYVDVSGPDGKTIIDFNKAYNPPCVFTRFATCPLPHRENVLPIRVEAGEKAWGGHL
jgi:uncharacterized protein (DUF1684 family)